MIIIAGIFYLYAPQMAGTLRMISSPDGIDSLLSSQGELAGKVNAILDPVLPFFGAGINSLHAEPMDGESASENPLTKVKPGIYTETLIDSGPLALVFMFWLFIAQARYSFAKFRKTREPEQKMYQLSFLILIFSFMVIGVFSNNFSNPIISMLFWFYLGLSVI